VTVRILHTSDWHLGRSFHRVDLLAAQAAHLDHLVEVVRTEDVDVVVVAGDVYDRALPGVDAVALLDDGLHRLVSAGAQVILSSGNHDSARRLGFGARMLAAAGVHVRTDPTQVGRPVVLPDRYGEVAFFALPYLEPALAAGPLETGRSHRQVLDAALRRARAGLAAAGGIRSVVCAHAFVTGADGCDSERELAVGGLGQVPQALFDGFDYVALGHLHGRQRLRDRVRYSGSPLAFSFSEADHRKGSWLVTLDGTGLAAVEPVEAPVPRPLARLRGRLDDLLTAPTHTAAESAWTQITLTDPSRPPEPMVALRRRFPHLLELRLEPADTDPQTAPSYTEKVSGKSDLDICCGFLDHVRGHRCDPQERVLLQQALEAGLIEDMEEDAPEHLVPGSLATPHRPSRRTGPGTQRRAPEQLGRGA